MVLKEHDMKVAPSLSQVLQEMLNVVDSVEQLEAGYKQYEQSSV